MDVDFGKVGAAAWRPKSGTLRAITAIDPVTLDKLVGVDRQIVEIKRNTERFLAYQPANNVLLWGARGTGKSSIVKALLNEYQRQGLRLIEVFKNDLGDLLEVVDCIRDLPYRFIIYCDDFSFEQHDNSYVALKTILEGSIEARPGNVLVYATSNRRHLVPEFMEENLQSRLVGGELHYADVIEEKLALSDRFGLWLSFYTPDFDGYLRIVDSYFPDFPGDRQALHEAATHFAMGRASHSGRTAKQFHSYYSNKEVGRQPAPPGGTRSP